MRIRNRNEAFTAIMMIAAVGVSLSLSIYLFTVRFAPPSSFLVNFSIAFIVSVCITVPVAILMGQANYRISMMNERNEVLAREAETARARFEHFALISSDWLFETDEEGHLTYSAGSAEPERARDVVFGKPVPLVSALALDETRRAEFIVRVASRERIGLSAVRVVQPGRQAAILELSAAPVFDKDGEFLGYRGAGRDITARHRAVHKIKEMANRDSLTGALNQRAFRDHMQDVVWSPDDPVMRALVLIDLDGFKAVNDMYGHEVGDRLLCLAHRRIDHAVRDSDMLFRLGGDEFAIWLDGLPPEGEAIDGLVRRLAHEFSRPFKIEDARVNLGVSVGVAVLNANSPHGKALYDHADIAMYKAKTEGGSQHRTFDSSEAEALERRRLLEKDLKVAIEENLLSLVYQPQVDIKTLGVVGFEALARWRHHEMGDISPGEFIPIAERAGLMPKLGRLVMLNALKHALLWPKCPRTGQLPHVSVNLSASVLFDDQLASTIETALASAGVDGKRLEIEITESVLLQRKDTTMENMRRLRAAGVSFAIDDFGTGFSSLSYLTQFPVQSLKIDQSFIADMESAPSHTVTRSIVQLTRNLNLKAVAEGVETVQHLEMLRELGCDFAQGYLFAKPLQPMELPGFIADGVHLPEGPVEIRAAG